MAHVNPRRTCGQDMIHNSLYRILPRVMAEVFHPLYLYASAFARAFDVAPRVLFDNKASNKFTVIEVNARDRSALLNRLARALFESRLVVHSAHVTNYGERAADTFYVTDLTGGKLQPGDRMNRIEARLMEAASDATQDRLENA